MNLFTLGWSPFFEEAFRQYRMESLIPARICRQDKQLYLILTEQGELKARLSGKLLHNLTAREDWPTIGDWVAVAPIPNELSAVIHAVLPRRSLFLRQAAGAAKNSDRKTEYQAIVANIDTAFLVSSLDGNFNPRRIERYLTLTWESGAKPVIVLNKSDIADNIESAIAALNETALGIPIITTSVITDDGLNEFGEHIQQGQTAVFLGSSGVGKSSLINRLLGEELIKTAAVRESDSKGRHTTTHRELFLLPLGGVVIDTPGMRELSLVGDEETLASSFSDIDELAKNCRFADCKHRGEPGCAVSEAVDSGQLASERLSSFRKQQRELNFLKRKENMSAQALEKARWKKISVAARKLTRMKYS